MSSRKQLNTSAHNKHKYIDYQKQKANERKRKAKEIIEEYKQNLTNTTANNEADLDISNSGFINRMADGQPVPQVRERFINFGG